MTQAEIDELRAIIQGNWRMTREVVEREIAEWLDRKEANPPVNREPKHD